MTARSAGLRPNGTNFCRTIPRRWNQSARISEIFRQPICYVLFTGLTGRDFLNPKGIQIIQPRVASLRATLGMQSNALINSERVESRTRLAHAAIMHS